MKFDFKTVVNRSDTGSMKWKNAKNALGKELSIPPFSTADMEFVCCPSVKKKITDALCVGVLGYTSQPNGYNESVVGWLESEHNTKIEEDWIIQTYGVIQAIHQSITCFSNEGDGVIIQTPVYHQFKNVIEHTDRKCVENPLKIVDGKYVMDFEDLEKKAVDAKILILCSPHNPVGRVWTRVELERVSEICQRNDVLIIADEIHFDFILKGEHTVFLNIRKENVILCTSPSKTFNLAGCNLSNTIIGDNEVRDKYKNHLEKEGVHFQNFFGYYATLGAYCEEGKEWKNELIEIIKMNYKLLSDYFRERFPEIMIADLEGTYLAWIDLNMLHIQGKELEQLLIEKGEVFVNEGTMFGDNGKGFVRINLACPPSIIEALIMRLEICFR